MKIKVTHLAETEDVIEINDKFSSYFEEYNLRLPEEVWDEIFICAQKQNIDTTYMSKDCLMYICTEDNVIKWETN